MVKQLQQVLALLDKNKIKIVLFLVVSGLVIFLIGNKNYKIIIEKIDDYSPDVMLKVYKNKDEVEVSAIKYLDGTLITDNDKLTASYVDIKDENKLLVVLKNKKEIKVQIEKE